MSIIACLDVKIRCRDPLFGHPAWVYVAASGVARAGGAGKTAE